ncbi:unnamed protein product, partial [Mesorhabditis spiculigera]
MWLSFAVILAVIPLCVTLQDVDLDRNINDIIDTEHGVEKWHKPIKPLKFTIIREPVDRFVSVYQHFCLRLDQCGDVGIHRFAQDLYDSLHGNTNYIRERQIHGHTVPQSNYCNMRDRVQDMMLIRYTDNKPLFKRRLMSVLKKARVPKESMKKALRHIALATTAHAADDGDTKDLHRALRNAPETLKIIRAIYRKDYEIFRFH